MSYLSAPWKSRLTFDRIRASIFPAESLIEATRKRARGPALTETEEGQSADETAVHAQQSNPTANTTTTGQPVAENASPEQSSAAEGEAGEASGSGSKRILIGSQRDPAAYRARPKRDWVPVEGEGGPAGEQGGKPHRRRHRGGRKHGAGKEHGTSSGEHQSQAPSDVEASQVTASAPIASPPSPSPVAAPAAAEPPPQAPRSKVELPPEEALPEVVVHPPSDDDSPVIPGKRQKLTAAMEAELDRAMAGVSFDDLMSGGAGGPQEGTLEPESRHRVKVVALRRDDVFVEFSGREQGCIAARAFEKPPSVGDQIEVIVQRYNTEENLYDLSLPGAAVDLGNWDEVHEGMLVDVQITGHNTGGLECEVNHIRGFIPVSQISLYRVEDLAQFVGQRFTCLITDANRDRKNLVLSRRAVLEREKEENKQKFFSSLAPGQIHDGTVRKLMDFGAFVELGNGVDGLLHVSQLSWSRVKHPSEVVQEGQPIRVRIEKIDPETGRIGLSYRDMIQNPWTAVAGKYLPRTQVHGKVTRLMDFGAFVEVEPGIEGLVHISEMSHKRLWRASDVVKEGDEIEVMVLSVDPQAQRMSLSIRALHQPEPTKKEKEEAQDAELPASTKKSNRPSNVPLKGGLGSAGGDRFGLKW
jgi:small subunit ribosomal protein S1